MGYRIITYTLHVLTPSSTRCKVFLFCIMLCFWGYLLYSHFGDRFTADNVTRESQRATSGNHISRGLLHEKNDVDTAEEMLEEVKIDVPDDDTVPDLTRERQRRRFPQAIIIGVKKGGTRAMLEYLRMHPDIVAAGAEPHFFNRYYDKGLEWYRNLMPKSSENQLTMEKTPAYFITKEVPARIHAMSKSTKLIVVVRNPVTRAISDYAQALEKKPNISSFETFAFKNRSAGVINSDWNAIQIGLYAKHLVNWIQYFPLKQLLVVNGERLITEPAAELDRVQDFLRLKKLITEKNFIFDAEKGFYCAKKIDEDNKIPHCLGKTKGRVHPDVDPEVVQQLKIFYEPFNRIFYQMVGQDFGWD